MNYKKVREIARKKSLVQNRLQKIAQSNPAGFLDTPNVEIAEGTRQKETDMPKNPKKLYFKKTFMKTFSLPIFKYRFYKDINEHFLINWCGDNSPFYL